MPLAFFLTSMAGATPELQALASGEYVLQDSIEDLENRKRKAMEESMAAMNFIVRHLAPERLENRPPLCRTYRFQSTEGQIELACDGKPPVPLALDGSPSIYQASGGSEVTVTAQARGAELTYWLKGGEGGLEIQMRFSEGRLLVVKEVQSPYLPVPLRMEYSYRSAP
jgi:hypothetical protein